MFKYKQKVVKREDNKKYLFAIALSIIFVSSFFFLREFQITGAATDGRIDPDSIVIGVDINGTSIAYPIDSFDVVNDVVGGTPIVITHDGAYERKVNGRYLEFSFVNGAITDSNGKTWVNGQSSYGNLIKVRSDKVPWYVWLSWHKDTKIYKEANK